MSEKRKYSKNNKKTNMVVLYTHMCQKEEAEGEKMWYEVI